MKSILLIGLGGFGRQVAMKLHEMNHQVLAIDKKSECVDLVLPYVTSAQIGDGSKAELLKTLEVKNFDVCIVAIGSDFQGSLETTSQLKELGAKMVVSRAAEDVQAKFLLRNGADEIVYPEKQLANWIAIRYGSNHILDYFSLGDDCAIVEVELPNGWRNKTIGELNVRKKYRVNILAIKKGSKMNLSITAETKMSEGDHLMVLGSNHDMQKCFKI